jgi:uncharacterized membrane protein
MEGYMFLVLLVVATPIVLGVWLIARAVGARQSIEELRRRVGSLELDVLRLKEGTGRAPMAAAPTPETVQPQPIQFAAPEAPPQITPKEIPVMPAPPPIPVAAQEISPPPPLPTLEPERILAPEPARKLVPAINWEQFMGVKLLAWIGGLAAFLAVAFFVKYSFDNNLISPEVRMALGFIAGLGLLVGGVVMSRKEYACSRIRCAAPAW